MPDGKPQIISGYDDVQTSLVEQTLVTVWRHIGEYHEHLVLVGGLVPRYLVDKANENEPTIGMGHCGTMDVDIGVSLAVADLETYESIRDRLVDHIGFKRGENDAGNKQRHSFVALIDNRNINIDFLTTTYEGPERKIREVEDDLSAIQVEGMGLALADPIIVPIRGDLLTGDGFYTAEVPVCRAVPYIVLKALSFSDRGERKDAYDLVYTLINYQDGVDSVVKEIRDEERKAESFEHAISELTKQFASEADNGPVAYGNFVGDRAQSVIAYATVQEFLASANI